MIELIYSILLILIKFNSMNCSDDLCNYKIIQSDLSFNLCVSDQCDKYLDPYSIMVEPNNCKTKLLYLLFSSYKSFDLFVNRIEWKLGDLFPRRLNNKIRLLRIYFNSIDDDDQPLDQNQLIRLGNNIDFYQLYIRNFKNKNPLDKLIHYDPNDPIWFIIKVQFICNSLIIYDQNPCATQIIFPSFFAPQRPTFLTKQIPLLNNFSSEQSSKQNPRSIHLILIILIPLLIILITIIIFIFYYKNIIGKRSSNTNSPTSSIPSLSNNIDNRNGEYSECGENAQPYHISRLPLPHKDSLYKEPQQRL